MKVNKKLVETSGNKKRAAIKLGCTVRTINRLIVKYKNDGKQGFVHGNRNKLPATTIPLDVKKNIIKLYFDKFTDVNFQVKISDTTLNKWLRDKNIISPKVKRKTKKIFKR